MDRWQNRVALVTGASVGIGEGIAKELVRQGMKVVGCARDINKLKELELELNVKGPGTFFAFQCDLSKDEQIEDMFTWIKSTVGGVDVLINNAGFSNYQTLLTGSPSQWRSMLDVNIIALCHCTKLAVDSMKERSVDDGQIIHISSISGHELPRGFFAANFYSATKHMVQALAEGHRRELREMKTKIRVTTLCPGTVATEFGKRMLPEEFLKSVKIPEGFVPLLPQDIADNVVHILATPPHGEIKDLIITNTLEV